MILDKFQRIQSGVPFHEFAPTINNLCGCGCGVELTGRKTRWASKECADGAYEKYAILKGNTGIIRKALFVLEQGYCRHCGVYSDDWQADHIVPVYKGGGGCGIENFQTLCLDCHKEKTRKDFYSK